MYAGVTYFLILSRRTIRGKLRFTPRTIVNGYTLWFSNQMYGSQTKCIRIESIICWNGVELQTMQNKLCQIQTLTCLTFTDVMSLLQRRFYLDVIPLC